MDGAGCARRKPLAPSSRPGVRRSSGSGPKARTSMGSNVRENWRTALLTCAGCCKSGSVSGPPTRPSIGPGGMRLGGAPCQEVSTRRRWICCKASPRSDTCPPVGKVTPHPDPPPQGGREISSSESPPQGGREISSPESPPQRGREISSPESPPQGGRKISAQGVRCPFCRSSDVEVISLFGSQVMTMQCKCRGCGSYFEASKY